MKLFMPRRFLYGIVVCKLIYCRPLSYCSASGHLPVVASVLRFAYIVAPSPIYAVCTYLFPVKRDVRSEISHCGSFIKIKIHVVLAALTHSRREHTAAAAQVELEALCVYCLNIQLEKGIAHKQ